MVRVVVVVFPGVQVLDATGPAEVFANASRSAGSGLYDVVLASSKGGLVTTSASFALETVPLASIRPGPTDTVLVAGGDEAPLSAAVGDAALLRWIRAVARSVRIGSVCSGAFVLAAAGLLDGLRVATHWSACDRLARFRPTLEVDREAIFVRNGRIWTSAGVTTGIDMALAMVEDDHGRALADRVAARLVLYVRRPGFQSQFSDALVAQTTESDPLAAAITWARAHLGAMDVPRLAKRAGMSSRTLHRRCLALTRATPAKLLERLRVEHARALLAKPSTARRALSQKVLASKSGFGTVARMRRAFERVLGMTPRDVRLLFGDGSAKS